MNINFLKCWKKNTKNETDYHLSVIDYKWDS